MKYLKVALFSVVHEYMQIPFLEGAPLKVT